MIPEITDLISVLSLIGLVIPSALVETSTVINGSDASRQGIAGNKNRYMSRWFFFNPGKYTSVDV